MLNKCQDCQKFCLYICFSRSRKTPSKSNINVQWRRIGQPISDRHFPNLSTLSRKSRNGFGLGNSNDKARYSYKGFCQRDYFSHEQDFYGRWRRSPYDPDSEKTILNVNTTNSKIINMNSNKLDRILIKPIVKLPVLVFLLVFLTDKLY